MTIDELIAKVREHLDGIDRIQDDSRGCYWQTPDGANAGKIILRGLELMLRANWPGTVLPPPADGKLEANFRAWFKARYECEYFGGINLCVAIAWGKHLLQQGNPVPAPVAVSERLPDLSPDACDFNEDGLIWWFTSNLGWRLGSRNAIDCLPYPTHWLPFHALPLPAGAPKS